MKGQPCLIREIKYNLNLPRGYKSNLEMSDICDREAINRSVEELEVDLRDNDYLSLK